MQLDLIATAAFGLEKVVVRELADLGYEARITRPGRILFTADFSAICRGNLWLRSADRVLVQLAEFKADDFDVLFETARSLPWDAWMLKDSAIPVRGRAHKSQLSSVPAIQRTVKKAIVERLLGKLRADELPETGSPVSVEVSLIENQASLCLDTTGKGLHRRGYRKLAGPAQLRETLAAGLVQLSFWKPELPFLDPFCGTGTIAIEAALIGRRMAPGRHREFAAENWPIIEAKHWQRAHAEADDLALPQLPERLIGTDNDGEALKLARYHAEQARVADDIHFQQREFADLSSPRKFGCLIANPPYGQRMGNALEITELYRSLPSVLRRLKTWSHFILSARNDFEQLVGQQADRRRKLYNGRIECTYYQFFGPRVAQAAKPSREATVKPSPAAFGGFRPEAERQATEFANRLRKRARHLRRWPTRRGITCYRLYERDIPEVPLVVDRYEDALHVAEFERPHERTAAEHADWLDLMIQTAGEVLEVPKELIFLKHRERKRGDRQYEQFANDKAVRHVQEGGLTFEVNLSDYVDTGLFLDHRITRGMVRDLAEGRRFLNLFAYTGAFTVYAASGGAVETISVDQSNTYLDWAERNLELNDLAGEQHHLVRDEAMRFLESIPEDEYFDLVVVDPPTFSNNKSLDYDWDIQRDYARLLGIVVQHLAPEGIVFFSTNSRRFKLNTSDLAELDVREITRKTIPEDFRNQRIHKCWRMERR